MIPSAAALNELGVLGFSMADIAALVATITALWAVVYQGGVKPFLTVQRRQENADRTLEHLTEQFSDFKAEMTHRMEVIQQQSVSNGTALEAIQRLEQMLSSMAETDRGQNQRNHHRNCEGNHE